MSKWDDPLPYGVPALFDTGPILQIARGNEVGRIIDQTFRLSEHWRDFCVSAITLGELGSLVRRNNWQEYKLSRLQKIVDEIYVLDQLNSKVLESYSHLSSFAGNRGRSIGQNDLWIAAFARTYDMVLITMDRDFEGIETELYDLRILKI